jgi:hypothetical protein
VRARTQDDRRRALKPGDLLVRDSDDSKTPLTPADIPDNASRSSAGRWSRPGRRQEQITI